MLDLDGLIRFLRDQVAYAEMKARSENDFQTFRKELKNLQPKIDNPKDDDELEEAFYSLQEICRKYEDLPTGGGDRLPGPPKSQNPVDSVTKEINPGVRVRLQEVLDRLDEIDQKNPKESLSEKPEEKNQ